MKNKKKSFLGTGWGFPPAFETGGTGITMVSDEEDIRQSLWLILSTAPGERLTNPEFGCDLRRVLFDPINSATKYRIIDIVEKAILRYEPRVSLTLVDVDTRNEDEGLVNLRLDYKIRKINIRTNVVFPFYKVEGTNIVEVQ